VAWTGDSQGGTTDATSLTLFPNLVILMNHAGTYFVPFDVQSGGDILIPNSLTASSNAPLAMNAKYDTLLIRAGGVLSGRCTLGAAAGGANASESYLNLFFGVTLADAIAARTAYFASLASQNIVPSGISLCIQAPGMELDTDANGVVVGTSGGTLNLKLTVNPSKLVGVTDGQFSDYLLGAFTLSY
jgi:hypothetical protein